MLSNPRRFQNRLVRGSSNSSNNQEAQEEESEKAPDAAAASQGDDAIPGPRHDEDEEAQQRLLRDLPPLPPAPPAQSVPQASCDSQANNTTTISSSSSSSSSSSATNHNTELGLMHLCYGVLGNSLWSYKTVAGMVEDTIEKLHQSLSTRHAETERTALQTIAKLSSLPDLQEPLFTRLHMILPMYMTGPGELKELCVEIVRNLSRCTVNKVSIYSSIGNPLLACLTSDGETENIRRYAIGAVNNIATTEQVALELMRMPGFVGTVVTLIRTGSTSTIKERAIWTLQSLACVDENERALYEAPLLVSTLVACLAKTETHEVQSYAMETLRNLAARNQRRMFANRALCNALLELTSHGEDAKLKTLALCCFERMGLDKQKVQAMEVLTCLSSVRSFPRLALMRCYFRVLPSDLIRKVGVTLSGNH